QAKGIEARRGKRVDVEAALGKAFAQKYPGVQRLVADLTLSSQFTLYLDEDVIQKNNLALREVEETAAKAVMSTGLFEVAYTKSDLLEGKPTKDPYIHFCWSSLFAPRCPNVTMMTKRNVSLAVTGIIHATRYDHDRH